MREQKPQPVAVCTRCGAVSYSPEMMNGQCSQVIVGKRCPTWLAARETKPNGRPAPAVWLPDPQMRNRAGNAAESAGCMSATASN